MSVRLAFIWLLSKETEGGGVRHTYGCGMGDGRGCEVGGICRKGVELVKNRG